MNITWCSTAGQSLLKDELRDVLYARNPVIGCDQIPFEIDFPAKDLRMVNKVDRRPDITLRNSWMSRMCVMRSLCKSLMKKGL